MKKIITTYLCGILFLSQPLFAQSPGGILRPAVWLNGNFSVDPHRQASLNFNPAMALENGDTSIKLSGAIESLRSVTILTVYLDSLMDKEKRVWEMTGEFGDLLLSTKQVSSKSKKTNVVFEKSMPNVSNPKTEAFIHSYSSLNAMGSASKEYKYKGPLIRFGHCDSSGSADGSVQLIAEFILYKKLLNEKERSKVETYLALKYGITLEKNYMNASGKTVWNRDGDNRFSNNIAGIARDDQTALLQKQSTSCTSNEQLVIGVNRIAHANSENTGLLNDGDYLIWGDNGENFNISNAFAAANEIMLSGKKWLMKASGAGSNKISTEVKINTKTILPGNVPARNFYLVINRSATAEFSPENCLYVAADTISIDGIASFANITWDADGSGKDHFTFGFKPELLPRLDSIGQSPLNSDPGMYRDGLLSFMVFPNPVSDGTFQLAIDLDKPTDIKINIYDLSQKLVFSREESGQAAYRFSDRLNGQPGTYIIQLLTPQAEFYRLLILQ